MIEKLFFKHLKRLGTQNFYPPDRKKRHFTPLGWKKTATRTKLLRHLRISENSDRENHSQEQFFSLYLLIVLLPNACRQKNLSFRAALGKGRGERKDFCHVVSVSMQGNRETQIAFVSTSSSYLRWSFFPPRSCLDKQHFTQLYRKNNLFNRISLENN